MARAAERKKHVKLRMDMFVLTFAIYGIMNMLALLVFLIELKMNKRKMVQENDTGTKDEKTEAKGKSEIHQNMDDETQEPDEINFIEEGKDEKAKGKEESDDLTLVAKIQEENPDDIIVIEIL